MTLPSFGQQALRASHWTRRGIVGLILRLGFFLALLLSLIHISEPTRPY